MNKKRSLYLLLPLISFCCLLAACGVGGTGTPTTGSTPTTVAQSSPTSAHSNTPVATTPASSGGSPTGGTVPMPSTSTSCPATGTGRAAVTAHLQLGNQQNVVYVYNVGTPGSPNSSFLKRHNIASGTDTVIANLPNVYIVSPQISADGQWLLFIAAGTSQSKVQLIRMDGQGLQTLYCAAPSGGTNNSSTLTHAQWSTDQRLVAFNNFSNNGTSLDQITVLNLQTGSVQNDLSSSGGIFYTPLTWLDNTRLYLSHQGTDSPADSLYLLNTSRGANQPTSNLTPVYQSTPDSSHSACWSVDSSYDGSTAYISECGLLNSTSHPGASAQEGPSDILAQPATGGTAHPIFSNATEAIMTVRAVTRTTLLFVVNDVSFDSGVNVDTSHNGLWKINTDGSGAIRLATNGDLNSDSQFPWSNISRDASLYSLQTSDGHTITLQFGSLSGGATTTFASTASGSTANLAIVGWTTM